MSTELVTILLFGGMLLFLMLGVPVAFGIGFITVVLTWVLNGPQGLYIVASTALREVTSEALTTIPLFLLMGNFLMCSGMSERLFKASGMWLSGLKGSIAVVSVGVCAALDMCTGFGPGILTMGLIAVPTMLRYGYDKKLALGSVLSGGVGDVIPPSIIMIIYAYIARLSIGKFFFAGVFPGLMIYVLTILYVLTRCYLNPSLAPRVAEHITWSMRWSALKEVVFPVILILVVLGSVFLGIATPTEAASVGAFGAFLSLFIYRQFKWKIIMDSLRETAKITGMALWILITATIFSVFYSTAGAQDMFQSIVQSLPVHPWVILVGMMVILLILGCFMDDYAIVTICAPIFAPIAKILGFDLIWFGVLFVVAMQIAYLTPPFGWGLFLMKGVAPPEVTTQDIWSSVPPFIAIQLFVLLLVAAIPAVATWLPGMAASTP